MRINLSGLLGSLLLASSVSAVAVEEVFITLRKPGEARELTHRATTTLGDPLRLQLVIKTKDSPRGQMLESLPGHDAKIRWYKVEPLMYHVDGRGHDPANPDFLWYANAGAPGGRTDRKPLPPDTITYRKNLWKSGVNLWSIEADARPTDKEYDRNNGLGTMHFAAELELDGKIYATPALTATKPNTPYPPRLAQLTVQRDKSYLGAVTSFFNVPGVFGSYERQVELRWGVDCADLVVGARRSYTGKSIPFTNVTGLRYEFVRRGYLELVAEDLWLNVEGRIFKGYSRQSGQLTGEMAPLVRGGDVIVFNYSPDATRRSWDHTGVLDRPGGEPPRALSGKDLIIHAGPAEAQVDPLASEKFVSPVHPTRFAILRWRETS